MAFSSSSTTPDGKSDLVSAAAALAIVALVVVILRSASEILIPITLSILVSFLLNPLVIGLHRRRVPRAIAVLLVVGAVFSTTYFLGRLMFSQMSSLAQELPRYSDTIRQRVDSVKAMGEGGVIDRLEEVAEVIENATETNKGKSSEAAGPSTDHELDGFNGNKKRHSRQAERIDPATPNTSESNTPENDPEPVPVVMKKDDSLVTRTLTWAAAPVGNFLAALGGTIALTFFALLRHEQMRNRVLALAGIKHITLVTRVFDEAGSRVSRYLLTQTLINGIYGILLATGLYFFGLPYAVLWGMLAFFFRFIPYVGPILVALLPITLGLIVFDDWTHPVGIIVFIALLELATNMIMEPIFYGHSVGMSDIAILVSVMFFTWLWGPIGMVIATPLTVCLVVFSKYTPKLSWVNTLVGAEPSLPPAVVFFQRLVANDEKEAATILQKLAGRADSLSAIDEIALPALSLARREGVQGRRLSSEEVDLITAKIHRLSEPLLRQHELLAKPELESGVLKNLHATAPTSADRYQFVCLGRALNPGCDDFALQLLSRAGGLDPNQADVTSHPLMSEWLDCVASCSPAAVILSTTPPGTLRDSEQHVKHLHERFPDLKIIVGRWGDAEMAEPKQALLDAGATAVVSGFKPALAFLSRMRLNGH